MGDIELTVSIPIVAAIVLGELLSLIWFSDSTPWGRRSADRFWISALLSDIALVFILKFISEKYFSVYGWEEALKLAIFVGALLAALEAPHIVHNHRSFVYLVWYVLHKMALVFVMSFSLVYFKNFKF